MKDYRKSIKTKDNFEEIFNTINKIKDITNKNDALFRINLY